MSLSIGVYDLLIILSLIVTSTASPHYAKPGCSDRCGNVRIPFPFGIGARCSLNEWYVINCNSLTTPYLSAFNHLEVVGVDLVNQTITVNTPTSISDCQHPVQNSSLQIKSVDLDGSPFRFARSRNKLVLEGCGNAVISHNGNALIGCSTVCRNDSTVREKNNCLGINCCETRIPNDPSTYYPGTTISFYLRSYTLELTGSEKHDGAGCGSAFFVAENLYVERRFSNQGFDHGVVPVSLVWTLTDLDFQQISCCEGFETEIRVRMANGSFEDFWRCYQSPAVEGNIYLRGGCAVREECASCKAIGGYCEYDHRLNFNCETDYRHRYAPSKSSLGVILGNQANQRNVG